MTDEKTIAKSPPTFNPKVFDSIMEKVSTSASSGGAPSALRRRVARLTVAKELCEPGYFEEDFQVEIHSLSSADELAALRDAKGDTASAHAMAKKSIAKVNGRVLQPHEVDVLWEILGFSGRMALAQAFLAHCTGADPDLMGKSVQSVEVS